MNNLAKLLLSLSLLFMGSALSAQTQPNLTGTWKLNTAKSEMGTGGVTAVVVAMDHKDPVLKYTVKGTAGGQDFEQTEAITTDGKTSRDSQGINVKAHWEGATLVAEGNGDDGSMIYIARLTVAEDGKTFTRVITQKDNPQPRHELYEKQ
jgi:hypothetical protein